MAVKSRAQIQAESNTTYIDNTLGQITPQNVRNLNDDWTDSTVFVVETGSMSVLSSSYAATASLLLGSIDSASYAIFAQTAANANTLNNLDSSSFVSTASYGVFSGSVDSRLTKLEATSSNLANASASFAAVSSSYSQASGSLSTRVTNLESTSSALTQASASFAQQSGSNSTRLTKLESTASLLVDASASFSTRISSNEVSISSLNSQTGSYATTGSNIFVGATTFQAGVTASNVLVTGTASISFLDVQFQSSSIIYSSGSNILGDAANDTQTLWGTVDVISGPLKVTGSADFQGGLTGSLLGTASYANQALSSSFASSVVSASYSVSSSYAATASFLLGSIQSSSYALSSSHADSSNTASYYGGSVVSASYSVSSSHADSANTASYYNGSVVSSSYAVSASHADSANTASYYAGSVVSASYSLSASHADSASTASFYGGSVTSASYALSASYANNALTASFFAGSVTSASFASTASFINALTQSVVITGSVQGNIVSASISSDTSSLDFSQGNFFTSLVSGSTHFSVTNLKQGQTVNVLLTTVGVATASFSPNVKQPSGSSYTPTSGSSKTDVLTFASWDSSNAYLVSVKNMI